MYRLTNLLLSAFVVSASLAAPLYAPKKGLGAIARDESQLKKDIDTWKVRAEKAMKVQDRRRAGQEIDNLLREADGLLQRCGDIKRGEWTHEVEQVQTKLERRVEELAQR